MQKPRYVLHSGLPLGGQRPRGWRVGAEGRGGPADLSRFPLDVLQDLVPEVLAADDVELLVDEVEEVLPASVAVDGVLENRQIEALGGVEDLLDELGPELVVNDVLVPAREVELLEEAGLAPNGGRIWPTLEDEVVFNKMY